MTLKKALEIVIELAEQNAITQEDDLKTPELRLESNRQQNAIDKIQKLAVLLG